MCGKDAGVVPCSGGKAWSSGDGQLQLALEFAVEVHRAAYRLAGQRRSASFECGGLLRLAVNGLDQ